MRARRVVVVAVVFAAIGGGLALAGRRGAHRAPAAASVVASEGEGESGPSTLVRPRITFSTAFPTAAVDLRIEDAAMSTRLDEIATRTAARIVVNGGFFDRDNKPVGLAMSEGKRLSAFSKTMSGGVLWIKDGLAHLTATEEYGTSEAGDVDFAIQCRPRLVVGSKVNIRSDDGRRARRTAMCIRDGGKTIEIDLASDDSSDGGPTLLELARELQERGCEEALNLDGGPSTGFAVRGDAGDTFRSPELGVRHAVVVLDR